MMSTSHLDMFEIRNIPSQVTESDVLQLIQSVVTNPNLYISFKPNSSPPTAVLYFPDETAREHCRRALEDESLCGKTLTKSDLPIIGGDLVQFCLKGDVTKLTLSDLNLLIQQKTGLQPHDLWINFDFKKAKAVALFVGKSTKEIKHIRTVFTSIQSINECTVSCDSNPKRATKKYNKLWYNLPFTRWITIQNLRGNVKIPTISQHIRKYFKEIGDFDIFMQRSTTRNITANAFVRCANPIDAIILATRLRMTQLMKLPLWVSPITEHSQIAWIPESELTETAMNMNLDKNKTNELSNGERNNGPNNDSEFYGPQIIKQTPKLKYLNAIKLHFISLPKTSIDPQGINQFVVEMCSQHGTVWSIHSDPTNKPCRDPFGYIRGYVVVEMSLQSEVEELIKAVFSNLASSSKMGITVFPERIKEDHERPEVHFFKHRRAHDVAQGVRPFPLDCVYLTGYTLKMSMMEIHNEVQRRLGRGPIELVMDCLHRNDRVILGEEVQRKRPDHMQIWDHIESQPRKMAVAVIMNNRDTEVTRDELEMIMERLNNPPFELHGRTLKAVVSTEYGHHFGIREEETKSAVIRISNIGRNIDEQLLLNHARSRKCVPPTHVYLSHSVQEQHALKGVPGNEEYAKYVPPGIATIHCRTLKDAALWMKQMHFSQLDNRRLYCQWWKEDDTDPHLELRGKTRRLRLYHLHWTFTNNALYDLCREAIDKKTFNIGSRALMDEEYIYPLGVGSINTDDAGIANIIFDAVHGLQARHLRIYAQFVPQSHYVNNEGFNEYKKRDPKRVIPVKHQGDMFDGVRVRGLELLMKGSKAMNERKDSKRKTKVRVNSKMKVVITGKDSKLQQMGIAQGKLAAKIRKDHQSFVGKRAQLYGVRHKIF